MPLKYQILKLGEKMLNFIKEMHIKSPWDYLSLNKLKIPKSLTYFIGKTVEEQACSYIAGKPPRKGNLATSTNI